MRSQRWRNRREYKHQTGLFNPQRHPHVKVAVAQNLLDSRVSEATRKTITGFRNSGEQLFYVTK